MSLSDDSYFSDESAENGSLKRRIDAHLDKYRYEGIESRYLSQAKHPTRELDEYFVNLQRALVKNPDDLRSMKLKFERGHIRQNIIKLRSIIKNQFRYDKLKSQKKAQSQMRMHSNNIQSSMT